MFDFEKIIDAIAEPINLCFFVLLLALFVFAVTCHLRNQFPKFVSISPNLLTGIGILGTFLGIFLGLSGFDSIEFSKDSVGTLLMGMRTAFFSSILGMFFGITMRFVMAFKTSKKAGSNIQSNEDFFNLIGDMKASIDNSGKSNEEYFKSIVNAIAGDDDSTITGQIKLLRLEARESHEEMKKEFINFGKKLAENNSKSLIEALEEVMRDFNAKINEQFGDNFKELNKAVVALLQWQENYKKHVETMEQQIKDCVDSIGKAQNAMQSIKENTDRIPEAMEKMPEIIKAANETLEAFSTMKKQALSAFPAIDENLKNLTTNLENQVKELEKMLNLQQKNYAEIESSFEGLSGKAEQALEQVQKSMTDAIEKMQKWITASMEQTHIEVAKALNEMQKGAGQVQATMTESISAMEQSATQNMENTNTKLTELLDKLTQEFQNQSTNAFKQMQDGMKESIDEIQAGTGKMQTAMTDSITAMEQSVTQSMKNTNTKMTELLDELAKEFSTQSKETVAQMQNGIKETLDEMQEGLKQSVEQSKADVVQMLTDLFKGFDSQAEEQLRNAIEEMGGYLAALLNRFNDYFRSVEEKLDNANQ